MPINKQTIRLELIYLTTIKKNKKKLAKNEKIKIKKQFLKNSN